MSPLAITSCSDCPMCRPIPGYDGIEGYECAVMEHPAAPDGVWDTEVDPGGLPPEWCPLPVEVRRG